MELRYGALKGREMDNSLFIKSKKTLFLLTSVLIIATFLSVKPVVYAASSKYMAQKPSSVSLKPSSTNSPESINIHQGDQILTHSWACLSDPRCATDTINYFFINVPAGMTASCTPSTTIGSEATSCYIYTTLNTPLGTYTLSQDCVGSDPSLILYCTAQYNTYQVTVLPAQYVIGVNLSVTPSTPLWHVDLDILLDPATIVCPATVGVVLGGTFSSVTGDVCGGNTVAHSDVHAIMPVFDGLHPNALNPMDMATVQTVLDGSDGMNHSFAQSVQLPPAPVWVGIGDSFSSGHHQDSNGVIYTPNDAQYSWVTQAATKLNNAYDVPPSWQMSVDLEAQSSTTTQQMVKSQMPHMVETVMAHSGSWNVVSIDGGANDMNFSGPLASYYLKSTFTQSGILPWDVQVAGKNAKNCLNTQAMWNSLNNKQASIAKNVQNIVNNAISSDPNVRIITLTYPYVMDTSNVCSSDLMTGSIVSWHGSKSVVDRLDNIDTTITASNGNIIPVDLRISPDFGSSPLGDLQLIYYFGYPHPNLVGQSAIAAFTVTQIEATHP